MAEVLIPVDRLEVGESGPAFLLDHTDPSGTPRPDVWRQAVADFYQLDLDASVLWVQIGPAPLVIDHDQVYMGLGPDAGEVTDILIDPSGATDQTIYITTDDGGVWGTTDGGTTWAPLTDQMFSISMGAIAMDPTNSQILYGGSGNLFDGGATFTKGAGIYRSADAGKTWGIVDGGYFGTLFANVGISRIVCPAADTLLVATNLGLYRSVDAGRNFGANAPDFNDRKPVLAGRICALLLDSAAPAVVAYAGVAGVGLMRSVDAGVTFATNLFSNPGAPSPPYNAFVVAQAQFDGATVNNAVLYASVQNVLATGVSAYTGFFRSVDSGSNWAVQNSLSGVAASNGFTQTYYDLTLGVDPLNSRRVYAGFQQLWLSVDGGTTFQAKAVTDGKVHWDNHAIVFSPQAHRPAASPVPVYTGTDGGIARSVDGGLTWTPINGTIATNLFRGIGIGTGAPNNAYTYGGCQDTGTSGHRPTDTATQWHTGINGDGWFVAVDPTDPRTVYGFDDLFFIKTTDAGATWKATYDKPATIGVGLANPVAQIYDRAIALEQTGTTATARTVYVSELAKLYKSTDSAATFAATPFAPAAQITCLVTTAAASATLWAGCRDGSVHCSLDGSATWDAAPLVTTPAGAGVSIGPVNGIAIDPTNTNRIAVVYGGASGIHARYRTQHVFLSLDGGATWNDVSGTDGSGPVGNLPDLPLRSVVFDGSATPPAIIVAGDAGVLRSTDATVTGTGATAVGTATWKIYGAALPMVCCNSLAIDNSVAPPVLRVGTYGRSCFEASRPAVATLASDSNLAFGTVALGESVTLSIYVYSCGTATLNISAASIVGGAPFTLGSTPALPVAIAPGATQEFQVTFAPAAVGDVFVTLQITSDDTAQPTRTIPCSGTGVSTGLLPRLATNPIASLGFGTASLIVPRSIPVQLFNVGTAPLTISAINQGGSTDYSMSPAPTFPIVIAPGDESDVSIVFVPSGGGTITATFSVVSNDASSPLTLTATGVGDQASAAAWATLLKLLGLANPANP